jgi:arylsulfatase A-like enzyme
MWSRRQFLASSSAFSERRPNIVIILTDDQGYGDFSLRKNPYLETPNLDRLAGESVEFTRFSVSPVCAPTRAALLTGRYPLRTGVHGVTKGRETMRSNELTLADCLKPAGYRTSLIGKWHLGENYPYVPHARGFDEFTGFRTGHWNQYFNSPVERNGKPSSLKGFIADALTDEAIRFISRKSRDPYFLYLAYNTPHSPYQVPDTDFVRFGGKGLSLENQSIYGMVSNLDRNIGRLMPHLDDNTIVLFLCDNGPQTDRFNAGLRGRKGSVYEGGTRSPLLVRYPSKLRGARQIAHITSHIDVLPTVLDLANVKRPDGPPLDGRSLLPLLKSDSAPWQSRLLFTHADQQPNPANPFPGCAREQRYKLVNANEIYDLETDPGETTNIASHEPQRVAQLRRAYDDWFASTLEGFSPGAPPIPIGYKEENPAILSATQSDLSGELRFFQKSGFANDFVTGWSSPADRLTWSVDASKSGQYEAVVHYRGPKGATISLNDEVRATTRHTTRMNELEIPHRVRSAVEAPAVYWDRIRLGRLPLPAGRSSLKLQLMGPSCDIKAIELKRH